MRDNQGIEGVFIARVGRHIDEALARQRGPSSRQVFFCASCQCVLRGPPGLMLTNLVSLVSNASWCEECCQRYDGVQGQQARALSRPQARILSTRLIRIIIRSFQSRLHFSATRDCLRRQSSCPTAIASRYEQYNSPRSRFAPLHEPTDHSATRSSPPNVVGGTFASGLHQATLGSNMVTVTSRAGKRHLNRLTHNMLRKTELTALIHIKKMEQR